MIALLMAIVKKQITYMSFSVHVDRSLKFSDKYYVVATVAQILTVPFF
jgi:hypothetical protein